MSARPAAAALFAGVATSSAGYTVMVAVLPLAAEDLLGSARWSGLPSSLATTGIAVGSVALASRRRGLAPQQFGQAQTRSTSPAPSLHRLNGSTQASPAHSQLTLSPQAAGRGAHVNSDTNA